MAVYQTLSVTESSVDTLANTSRVKILWKSQQTGESHNNNTRTAQYWITVNGTRTAYTVSYTLPAKTTKTILSLTITVPHREDGTGTMKVETWMDTRISAGEVELSKTLTLTAIPRASTVGAADAFIESTTVIGVNRKSEAYTHSVAFSFGQLTGYIDDAGGISDVEIRHTASSIPFRIPTQFYTYMTDKSSDICRLTCRTYQGDDQIGSDQQAQFTVSAKPELCMPVINWSVEDVNPVTLALTGNREIMVRHASIARYAMSAQGRNGAKIQSRKINGQETEGTLLADPVTEDRVQFFAEDSRGFTAAQTAVMTVIPYVPVTLNAKVTRTDPTSGNGILEANGQCWAKDFGASVNALTLQYRINNGPVETAQVSISQDGLYYEVQKVISGLEYSRTNTVEVTLADALSKEVRSVSVKPGIPVFDWGEKDFAFHVPVSMQGQAITDVKDPVGDTDAVNKAYVDSQCSMKLLWENEDPTNTFGPQTIPLDLRKYCGIFICFSGVSTASGRYVSEIIPVGNSAYIHCHAFSGTLRQRNVMVTQTGVEFFEGHINETVDDRMVVPLEIYGFRGNARETGSDAI